MDFELLRDQLLIGGAEIAQKGLKTAKISWLLQRNNQTFNLYNSMESRAYYKSNKMVAEISVDTRRKSNKSFNYSLTHEKGTDNLFGRGIVMKGIWFMTSGYEEMKKVAKDIFIEKVKSWFSSQNLLKK